MFLIDLPASRPALLAILITWAFGLPTSNAQTFALTDATALVPVNVKAAAAEYSSLGTRPKLGKRTKTASRF
jgi:hypothetical protein